MLPANTPPSAAMPACRIGTRPLAETASSTRSHAPHFDRRDQVTTIDRLVKRLTDLGCQVEVRRNGVA
jgi:hypothetical protein